MADSNDGTVFWIVVILFLALVFAPGRGSSNSSADENSAAKNSAAKPSSGGSSAKGSTTTTTTQTTKSQPAQDPTPERIVVSDDVNPEATRCADDAATADTKQIVVKGQVWATIQLRYSAACRTAWVRTYGSGGTPGNPVATWGKVHRTSDGLTLLTRHCSGTICWSNMVNDANDSAFATGGFAYSAVNRSTRTNRY